MGNIFAPGIGGAIGGALGSALGGSGSSQSGTQQTNQSGTQNGTQNNTQSSTTSNTSSNTLNPAVAQLLGLNGNGGVLGGLGNMLNGGSNLSGIGNSFLNANAGQILNNGYATTNALANDQFTTPRMQAAQISAPSQNNIDLAPTFQSLLAGGDTSKLMSSLQAGNALAGAQFQQNQTDLTNNLQRDILPGIRSNSVLAGQYGGSRQGVAEGLAISDLTKQLNNSNTQFGLGTTAANSSALAGAYENGQNRALSAAQGLSAQQYGTAQQDAAARQAADIANMGSENSTNALNASKMANGVQLQQGLLGTAAGYGNSDLSRLGMGAGILQPFLGAGATTTNNGTSSGTSTGTTTNQTTGNVSQPLYQNTAGNILGGAMLGSQLGGLLGGPTGGTSVFNVPSSVDNMAKTIGSQSLPINTNGFMNFSF
ncbi:MULTISPECIES: hypothetical protein [unclassified Massilia]|uniref:hypothetical protein n=1 Tax=unclassified Massilia TaxID=2609279 RepID=UPI0012E1B122|nr:MULTISPECIES: hypothetical protein [unclassified Massilia]